MVNVPPLVPRFAVLLPKSNIPDVMVRFAAILAFPVKVREFPPPTATSKLLKLAAPIEGAAPVNLTVPVAVSAPDSVQTEEPVPVTVIVLPLSTIVPPV
jgi:hypothetical protein